MAEELNTNPTPPAVDAPVAPVEAPIETPIAPAPPPPITEPTPEPTVPAEPTPAPVSPAPAPTPPAPAADNTIQRLLAKAKEKIQFRKQAKLEKIMAFAKAQGSVTNDQAQKLLRVSDATASRYLAQLVKSGRLRPVKAVGRGARYTPTQ